MNKVLKSLVFFLLFLAYSSKNLSPMLAGMQRPQETFSTFEEADESDDAFLSYIRLDTWLNHTNASELGRVFRIFNNRISNWFKNSDLWVNHTAPTELINGIYSGELKNPLMQNVKGVPTSVLPFLVKWVVDQNCVEFKIGDLHGNMNTLTKILLNSKIDDHPILDAKMRMHPQARIVFLGDYMDRGMESIKLLATAALLALKNPGQVLMLRGNHEDIILNLLNSNLYNEIISITAAKEIFDRLPRPDANIIPYEKTLHSAVQNSFIEKILRSAGICDSSCMDRSYEKIFDTETIKEINQFSDNLLNNTGIKEIVTELPKLYEFLPLGAFIGFEGKLPTRLVFNSHGCIDVRINYRHLLECDTENMAQSGGIKLWQLTPQVMFPQESLFEIYKDITQKDPYDIGSLLFHVLKQEFIMSFAWNDILAGLEKFVEKNERGSNTFIFDAEFIKAFLCRFNSPNVFVCGMARGHQHNLPKKFALLGDTENDFWSMCKRSTSPSVLSITDKKSQENLTLLLKDDLEFDLSSGIITIISGTIMNGLEASIMYPSSWLETHKNQLNELPRTKLVCVE